MNASNPEEMSLETCVRQALEQGELNTALETRIQQIVDQGNLTDRDRQLLELLLDAIQDDCIRRE